VQVDYDKIAIDYCWSSRASSPDVTLRPSPAINTDPLKNSCVNRHASVDFTFIADAAAKMLKSATYFAYNGLPWRLPTLTSILESSCLSAPLYLHEIMALYKFYYYYYYYYRGADVKL